MPTSEQLTWLEEIEMTLRFYNVLNRIDASSLAKELRAAWKREEKFEKALQAAIDILENAESGVPMQVVSRRLRQTLASGKGWRGKK